MRNLKQVKNLNDIKNIIKVEKEKFSSNQDYLPATELVLLTNEELKLLSLDATGEPKGYSTGNPKLNGNSGNDLSRYNYLMGNMIDMESDIYDYFQLILVGLGYKVNDRIKSMPNTKNIVKALSSELTEKCRFNISKGQLRFELKGDDSFLESNEAGILITLGVFACLRINLEYLEIRNPELKAMNEILYFLFPEAKQAYDEVSKKFGFNKTVFVGFTYDSPEELLEHMKAMKLESWNQGNISNHYLSNNGHLN